MRNPLQEDKEFTGQLFDDLSQSFFGVTVSYSVLGTEVSVEDYDLEGISVSRDDLVNIFGEGSVLLLEEELN